MLANINETNIDRSNFTITFRRVFAASRERVFDAWTRPEHVEHWWDPRGIPLSECLIDLRPGGSFKFTNQDSGHAPPFSGTYRRIERPSLLEFEALGAVGTVRIDSKEAATHMSVSIRCASAEHLEQFVKIGVAKDTARTMDNLVAYLADSQARPAVDDPKRRALSHDTPHT